jgi:hypothetical protein
LRCINYQAGEGVRERERRLDDDKCL